MMAHENIPSNSFGNELSLTEGEIEVSLQKQRLTELKRWIETEAGFYGRTDEDFLLVFLRGSEFDMEVAKQKITRYYESRRDIPQWWANRNVKDDNIASLLPLKTSTVIMDGESHHPTVVITKLSSYGKNLNNFDDYCKLNTIFMEVLMRRRNCQLNGDIWIMDFSNYKWWIALHLLNPVTVQNFARSFIVSLPIKVKGIVVLNASFIGATIFKLLKTFLPESLNKLIHIYGSDWSTIGEHVPLEQLPEEYGGQAGPMAQHENAFINEILSFNDYLIDDNKYGFQSI